MWNTLFKNALIHNKGETMSVFERLTELNLPEDTTVTMSYSDGADVFVHNETAVDTAIGETCVISEFCDLIATPGLRPTDGYGTDILQSLRDNGYLEDYDRTPFNPNIVDSGGGYWAEYLKEVMAENFYDQEFIESSVQSYDYKRGFCTLETNVQTTVGNLLETRPFNADTWTISVQTPNGTLTFD